MEATIRPDGKRIAGWRSWFRERVETTTFIGHQQQWHNRREDRYKQSGRTSRLKSLLGEILKKVTFAKFTIAALALPLIVYVYREVTREALIIDPFTVSKDFEEMGLTSEVMAYRIGDSRNQIEEATQPWSVLSWGFAPDAANPSFAWVRNDLNV
jgi:hypothetical protein